MRRTSLLLAAAGALAACAADPGAAGPDAGTSTAAPDSGSAVATALSAPQLRSLGGAVVAAPVVVPIFFAGDDATKAQIDAFLAALGPSDYWRAATSEYGVGALTAHAAIVSTDQPPTTDDALQRWLAANVGAHGWPAPDASTIYAVFLPASATLSAAWGTSCKEFGGYHGELTGGTRATYALLPRCSPSLDALTGYTSHELVEAATDPHPFTAPGWADIDSDHAIWADTPGAEVGDMCEFIRSADQRLVGSFVVQRSWSNASAAAGHDPCVPAMSQPYIAAVPQLDDAVTIAYPADVGGPQASRGVTIPVGSSKTIDVALYSDAAGPDFTVTAYDVGTILGTGATPELTFAWDQTTGHGGDVRKLTITHAKAGTYGGSELVISARQGNTTVSLWWGFVAN
jgi:hypothetical protein